MNLPQNLSEKHPLPTAEPGGQWNVLQPDVLLRSKLSVPRQTQVGALARPRLLKRLEGSLACPLTVISAPAGYGKTTLLKTWVGAASKPWRAAWLAVDEQDNAPIRFWRYFMAALEGLTKNIEAVIACAAATLYLSEDELAAQVERLVLAVPGEVVLVLDDYHLINEPGIQRGVAFLLEHLPPALHLVLAGRSDPSLPLALLRGRGQILELRAADLAFSAAETTALFKRGEGIALSLEDIATLTQKTEGWAAGLQMASLWLQGRTAAREFITSFSGNHQHIYAYLADEVFERQELATRRFLLATSILERFNRSLGEALMDEPGGNDILADLERNHLFLVPLDDEGNWFRYHTLFLDFLRRRLAASVPSEQVNAWHRRAGAWFERQAEGPEAAENMRQAVRHAYEAADFTHMASLAETAAQKGYLDSRMSALISWVEQLPAEVIRSHPYLQVYYAWALFLNGQLQPANRALFGAREALENLSSGDADHPLLAGMRDLLGLIETLISAMANVFLGNLEQAGRDCAGALNQAERQGYASLAGVAIEGLAHIHYQRGELHESARLCRRLINLGKKGSIPLAMAANGYIHLGGILLEWNDLDSVADCLQTAQGLMRLEGGNPVQQDAAGLASGLEMAKGDLDAARAILYPGSEPSPPAVYSIETYNLDLQRIRLCLAEKNLAQAGLIFNDIEEAVQKPPFPHFVVLHEARQVLLARLRLAQNNPAEALSIIEPLIGPAQAAGRRGRVIEFLFLKALALQAGGQETRALEALQQSLTLAGTQGYRRLFLDEGSRAVVLFELALKDGATGEAASDILALLKPASTTTGHEAGSLRAGLAEPLTPSEKKILELLAEGCSNQEICERLVIALNTVKRHTNSIYGKLGVKSRTQAIVKARRLGLVA